MKKLQILGLSFISIAVIGCGGGGSSSNTSSASDNTNFSEQQPVSSITIINKEASSVNLGATSTVQVNAKTIDNSVAVDVPKIEEVSTLPTTQLVSN